MSKVVKYAPFKAGLPFGYQSIKDDFHKSLRRHLLDFHAIGYCASSYYFEIPFSGVFANTRSPSCQSETPKCLLEASSCES